MHFAGHFSLSNTLSSLPQAKLGDRQIVRSSCEMRARPSCIISGSSIASFRAPHLLTHINTSDVTIEGGSSTFAISQAYLAILSPIFSYHETFRFSPTG